MNCKEPVGNNDKKYNTEVRKIKWRKNEDIYGEDLGKVKEDMRK